MAKASRAADGDPPKAAAEAAIAPPAAGPAPLPLRQAAGLAALSGVLYFVAFPGIDVWPVAFVALVPLLLALRGQTPRRGLLLGWITGFFATMIGFYWLLTMLKTFSGMPNVVCALLMAVLCGYQAGRIALCGWLAAASERKGWPAAASFAAAFVASELLFPLLFPWYYGSTVHDAPIFSQLAEVGGPYIVALVLVAPNLAIAEYVLARRHGRAPDRRLFQVGIAVPALAAVYGMIRMGMVDARVEAAEGLKIGVVQANQPLLGRSNALRVHITRTRELKEQGAGLVLWSEGGSGIALREGPNEEETRRVITSRLGVPTVIGTVLARLNGKSRPTYFNTAMLAGADGTILGRYDKHFLLAFGEYIPFGETLPVLYDISPNSSHFASGDSVAPLVLGDHRFTTLICYEDILPSFVNAAVREGDPDVILNLTNDTWFGNSTEPWIHLGLAQMRAIEHRRFLVRATNSGVSAIVDPVGRVVKTGTSFHEESWIGDVKYLRGKTVYEVVGDVPWYAVALASIAMAVRRKRERSS